MSKVLTYRIELLQPVLVSALDGDPNSAVAFNYLPGSVLRGALLHRYSQQQKIDLNGLLAGPNAGDMKPLFFDGSTRFLNAYLAVAQPAPGQLQRTLPVSLSWHQKKLEQRTAKAPKTYDLAFMPVAPRNDPRAQWKDMRGKFYVGGADNSIGLHAPQRSIMVHTQRSRSHGRAMPQDGAVYRYDALAKGQTFVGVILCDDDTAATKLAQVLNGEFALGGSRSAGYGRVRFSFDSAQDIYDAQTWGEAASPKDSLQNPPAHKLLIALLSDVVLRDTTLGLNTPAIAILQAALRKALACDTLTVADAFASSSTLGGFNQTWGLPVPQMQVLSMGTVLVCDVPGATPSANLIQKLEREGLGERKAEGFGRVAVNKWLGESLAAIPKQAVDAGSVVLPEIKDEAVKKVAERMRDRLVRMQLDEQIGAAVNSLFDNGFKPGGLKPSQLQRLRAITRDALMQPAPDIERINKHMTDIKTKGAGKQFEQARLDGKRLSEWVTSLVASVSEEGWYGRVGLTNVFDTQIGKLLVKPTPALRVEFTLRYLEAVLARAAKECQKEAK
jgi:CRISPR-associated protein Csx10